MKGLSAMCKINPESSACNRWQHEVCGKCPNWNLEQNKDQTSSFLNSAHKLMTTDECQRLKRELEATLFRERRGLNPTTFLLLLFFIIFCISLIAWLLARAFVFKKPNECDRPPCDSCPPRACAGLASTDHILHQLRERCTTPGRTQNESQNLDSTLYVPPSFWGSFHMKGCSNKSQDIEQQSLKKSAGDKDNELGTESSEESSDDESDESVDSEEEESGSESNSEGKCSDDGSMGETTESSKSKATTERSTADEDHESSTSTGLPQEVFTDPIGRMPTTYGTTHNSINESKTHSRGKLRWANWLTRNNQRDSDV